MSDWSNIINKKPFDDDSSINTYNQTRKNKNKQIKNTGIFGENQAPSQTTDRFSLNSTKLNDDYAMENNNQHTRSKNKYYNLKQEFENASLCFSPSTESLNLIKYKKKTEENTPNGSGNENPNNQQKKREIYSVFIFVFFLFVIIITLSQILVLHNQTHHSNFFQIKIIQDELKLMDRTMDEMLNKKKVLPMQVWYAIKKYNENLKRFSGFLHDYSNLNTASNSDSVENSDEFNKFLNSHESLINQLNFCEQFTNQQLILLEEPLVLASNILNKTLSNMPHLVYKHLADSLMSIQKMTNIPKNKQSSYMNKFSEDLNSVLNSSLSRIHSLYSRFNESVKSTNKKCISSITASLFNLFSKQYTNFYEAEFRQLIVNKYQLINKTLSRFKLVNNKISNTESESLVLKLPLRNLNELYETYKKKQERIAINASMCPEQPPNLCKN